MSGENNEPLGMRLRPRRSVLGDISNRASIGLPAGHDALGKPVVEVVKPQKRLVSLILLSESMTTAG